MKSTRILFLLAGTLAPLYVNLADAATVVTQTYLTDTTITGGTGASSPGGTKDFFLNAVATWTINPGVTVTSADDANTRFFIGSSHGGSSADAVFEITGGGTFDITNSNTFTMRLGQGESNEAGVLRITGGSTVRFSGNQGPYSNESNGVSYGDGTSRSRIEMSGIGSTFSARGTYNSTTQLYNRGTTASEALPISATGVGESLTVSYDPLNNVTTFTVVPESSAALLGAFGALGLLRRRR